MHSKFIAGLGLLPIAIGLLAQFVVIASHRACAHDSPHHLRSLRLSAKCVNQVSEGFSTSHNTLLEWPVIYTAHNDENSTIDKDMIPKCTRDEDPASSSY